MLTAWLLAAALAAYNAAVNLVIPLGRWYTAVHAVLTAVLVGGALAAGFTADELGLGNSTLAVGLAWGTAAVAAIAVVFLVAWSLAPRVTAIRSLLQDRRVTGMTGGRLAFATLVRIPVGTAAFEEVAFRGLLLAAFARAYPDALAVLWSSVAFGLWHVGPTIPTARLNLPADGGRRVAVAVAIGVVTTTAAGVGFALLRLWTGNVLAPVLAHWAFNAFGLLTAVAVQRTDPPVTKGGP